MSLCIAYICEVDIFVTLAMIYVMKQLFFYCALFTLQNECVVFAQLHTHMEHVLKHQNQQRAINLNNAESQTMHLETRLVLLDSSIQIELWQVKLIWPDEMLLGCRGAVFC